MRVTRVPPGACCASVTARPLARSVSIDASSIKGRHLDSCFNFSGDELKTLLRMAAGLKRRLRAPDSAPYRPLVRSLFCFSLSGCFFLRCHFTSP